MFSSLHQQSRSRTGHLATYGPALFCFLASFIILLFIKLAPADSRDLAVVFPAGYSLEESFRATAGSGVYVTGSGAFDNIVHFRTPRGGSRQDILDKLYAAGAVIVINPFGAVGCFARTPAQYQKKVATNA
ncbi:hypothetical protein [Emcibacter nanhaiensis]|uniref:Uncharacterized protein n=1 Tax=Emcibacter nanhaiensis TaxID=1505037 RepID=A0A501PMJ8_9PROT|nr:hypothetical protein [Emcibacter nanhaiensis]TPD61378.1 hypothetical protein FIV46_03995 [Emcibacter nanhaiensis]